MKVFSGNSNKALAIKVCDYLDKKLSDANISKFSDGEIKVVINENVRKHDCFIIQSMDHRNIQAQMIIIWNYLSWSMLLKEVVLIQLQ